jgi:hypothetical protein
VAWRTGNTCYHSPAYGILCFRERDKRVSCGNSATDFLNYRKNSGQLFLTCIWQSVIFFIDATIILLYCVR